jgi:hypothetical protein
LKYCVPIAAMGFVGVALWTAFQVPFVNDLAPQQPRGAVREHWVEQAKRAADGQQVDQASAGSPQDVLAAKDEFPVSDVTLGRALSTTTQNNPAAAHSNMTRQRVERRGADKGGRG